MFATVFVALFLIDDFEHFHLPHVLHFFFPTCDQQRPVNPYAVDSPTICCSNQQNVNESTSHGGSFGHLVSGQELYEV